MVRVALVVFSTLCFCAYVSCLSSQASHWELEAPDQQTVVTIGFPNFWTDDETRPIASPQLCYRILRRDSKSSQVLLQWSPLGVRGSKGDSGHSGKKIPSPTREHVKEVVTGTADLRYTMPHGKRREHQDHYNSLTMTIGDDKVRYEIRFRVYNDGVAFSYGFSSWLNGGVIEGEETGFHLNMAHPPSAWLQEYEKAAWGTPANENPYENVPVGTPSVNGDGWSFPALFHTKKEHKSFWFLLTEAGVTKDYCGTRLQAPASLDDGMYKVRFPSQNEGNGIGEVRVVTTKPFNSPWRLIILGNLKNVVESSLVYHVSPSLDEVFNNDVKWVIPGLSAWSWFSQETGTPGMQREYLDSASEFGWRYSIVDANWDMWTNDEDEIQKLVSHGASLYPPVGVWLWYNSGGPHNIVEERPRDRMLNAQIRRKEFKKISTWGVKGVKVDFWGSDKQDRIQQYLDLLKDAAEYHLLVSFHGCTIPRGWSRQFPNLLTMESVRGAEYYKTKLRTPSASDHVIYTMTRNVVGPMDYTPLAFEAAYSHHKVTFAHSFALSVVFESGVVAFADRADASPIHGFRKLFTQYPFAREFLAILPVGWDETVFLSGSPESHVVLARRSGEQWWIAGITGEKLPSDSSSSIDVTLDWSLLLSDAAGGSKNVLHYRYWKVSRGLNDTSLAETLDTRSLIGETEKMRLGPSDGFVIQLSPLRLGVSPTLSAEKETKGLHTGKEKDSQGLDGVSVSVVVTAQEPDDGTTTLVALALLITIPLILWVVWKSKASILRALGMSPDPRKKERTG